MNYTLEGVAAICSLLVYMLVKWVSDSRRNARNDHRIEVMEEQVKGFNKSLDDLKNLVHQEQLDTRKLINDSMNSIQRSLNAFEVNLAKQRSSTPRRKPVDA
jgi:hypothetical protein